MYRLRKVCSKCDVEENFVVNNFSERHVLKMTLQNGWRKIGTLLVCPDCAISIARSL